MHCIGRAYEAPAENIQWAGRYRCLQLLQNRANEVFKVPLAAIKILFLLSAIHHIYGVVKMDGLIRVLNLKAATTCLVFLAVAFKALAEVYERSVKALLQQRRRMADKWFRRFHRSCAALKFEVAGMYFVDSPMCLTMGSFVIINVANMLILGT